VHEALTEVLKPLFGKVEAGDRTLQEVKKLLHNQGLDIEQLKKMHAEGPKKKMVNTMRGQLAAVTLKVDVIKDEVDAIKDVFKMNI
jgi:hypothetical protein